MKKKNQNGPKPVRSFLALLAAAAEVLFCDQLTKALAVEFLKPLGSVPIIPGFFHLSFVENSGIAFGLLQHRPEFLTPLISLSVLLLLAGAWLVRDQSFARRLAYGFILGGALGNWLDRIRFHAVIDFLDFRIWPVFNIADSFITIGVVLFLWLTFRRR